MTRIGNGLQLVIAKEKKIIFNVLQILNKQKMKNCIGTTKASRTLPQAIYCSVKFSSRSNNLQNSSSGALLKLVYTFRLLFFFALIAPSIQWNIAQRWWFLINICYSWKEILIARKSAVIRRNHYATFIEERTGLEPYFTLFKQQWNSIKIRENFIRHYHKKRLQKNLKSIQIFNKKSLWKSSRWIVNIKLLSFDGMKKKF